MVGDVAVGVSGFSVDGCDQSFEASGYLDVQEGQFTFLLFFNSKSNVGVLVVVVDVGGVVFTLQQYSLLHG